MAVWGHLRGHLGGGIDLSFVRVADHPPKAQAMLPRTPPDVRVATIRSEESEKGLGRQSAAATGAVSRRNDCDHGGILPGFRPGALTSFGVHQLLLLLLTMDSRDYMRLLLLIG